MGLGRFASCGLTFFTMALNLQTSSSKPESACFNFSEFVSRTESSERLLSCGERDVF